MSLQQTLLACVGTAVLWSAAQAGVADQPRLPVPPAPLKESEAQVFPLGRSPWETETENPELTLYRDSPGAQRPPYVPKPFISLKNAAEFIQSQRGREGRGLPATFYVPDGIVFPHSLRRLITTEGVGLYDTALALIALIEADRLTEAREILDIYVQGSYAADESVPFPLRAYPSASNGAAFAPLNDEDYYLFDFTNVTGDWQRWAEQWKFWTAHTGPNAWMINALVRFVHAGRRRWPAAELRDYIILAEGLGRAMQRLQDDKTLGGVRYGPRDMYHAPGTSDPYFEINSENNISAYTSFNMLYRLTGNPAYQASAAKILEWFRQAPVWTREGLPRQGLYDHQSGTLAMGAEYKEGRWVLQTEHPTDSGGTWTISCFGPELIDRLWGPGAAYEMWESIRRRAGREMDGRWIRPNRALAGLDYTDAYPEQESLISTEWTTGGLFALKLLIPYYETGIGKGVLSPAQIAGMRTDTQTMTAFIRVNPNPYATGPGHGGSRQGQTGFGWFSPPQGVQAIASIYVALFLDNAADPAAWWRTAEFTSAAPYSDKRSSTPVRRAL